MIFPSVHLCVHHLSVLQLEMTGNFFLSPPPPFFFLLWKTVSRWRKFNHFYHFSSSTVCQKIYDRIYWWCPLCLPSYPQGFFLSLSGLTSTQYLLHLLLVFDVPRAWALLLQWSDVVRMPGTAQDSLLLLLPNYLLLLMELEISHIHEDV